MSASSTDLQPHYITFHDSQLRVWRGGHGPDLLVLPGLALGASVQAARMTALVPNWTVTVLELPGLGGSHSSAAGTLDDAADRLAVACRLLEMERYALVSFDLASPLADRLVEKLADKPLLDIRIGVERARGWKQRGFMPPDLAARPDGTHLTALWAHIRDCHLIDPADARFPAFEGDTLPAPEELHATFVAAGMTPTNFSRLWSLSCAALNATSAPGAVHLAHSEGLTGRVANIAAAAASRSALPGKQSLTNGRIWNDYVELPAGRVHVRRAGMSGQPLLLFPSGGGSSETFAPVIQRLARSHQVVAMDYLGNGESDKPEREVTIERLAEDAKQLADVLGFDNVDLWGSHTGALIAMEFAVRHTAHVRRAVLEGPVFISAAFQADLLERYFPAMRPDPWGLHLPLFWNWRRDLFMYWPWYRVEYATARRLGIPDPADMHRFVMGLLQSGPHYSDAYRSAYIYSTSERIGLLKCPTLVCAGPNDMLVDGLPHAQRLAPNNVSILQTPTTAWWPAQKPDEVEATLAIYDEFFAQP